MRKTFPSRLSTRVLGILAVVILTGCEVGIDAGAMPDLGAVNAITAPAPAAPPVVTTEVKTNYGIIETYMSAAPGYDNSAQGKINGLTPTSGNPGAVEKGAADAPKKQNKLVKDTKSVIASGGTAVIVVKGNTDPEMQNTTNSKLSLDRAKKAAQELARELNLKPSAVVKPVGADCSDIPVCIQYKAGAVNNIFAGRNAVAVATFTSTDGAGCLTPPCPTNTTIPDTTTTIPGTNTTIPTTRTTIPGTDTTIPDTDNDGGNNGGNAGGNAGGSTGDSNGGSDSDDPYSDDPYSGEFTPDNTSLRITVSAPDPFRVGGTLREQTVKVTSAVLLCDDQPCSGAAEPTLNRFVGELSITSSSTRYAKCAYSTSSNCAFYIAKTSTPEVRASGSNLIGGIVRAGFVSPTPSGVYARPTLKVDEVKVLFPGSITPVEVEVTVVWTTGEADSGRSVFSVNRRVIGSIGS